ncbi:MAG: hypothetical protein ABSC42_07460 [Tepidisphaeraceae bacterium]
MKPLNQKKVLGLAMGERSLMAAELVATEGRPQVKRLAELLYPEGISISQPAELAKALGHFLKDNHFSTRSAVIGIPLKWLVVKAKDVPPADDATVAQLLRLEAESEFSTELKDLVYDFAGDVVAGSASRTVLLAATPRKYVDCIESLCDGARLQPLAIMPSALALGTITGGSLKRDVLVLAAGFGGSELSAQRQSTATAMRSLRPAMPQPPFISELRRQLGVNVQHGELGTLGVEASGAGINGQGEKFAAAVALALSAMDQSRPGIDFLHSRLAPPRKHRIPRWGYLAGAAVVLCIALGIYAYTDLDKTEQAVNALQAQISNQQKDADEARDFVAKESLAQYWHGGDPRYLACMRDLDDVIPEDGQTYATNLEIKAETPPLNAVSNLAGAPTAMGADGERTLFATLQGHTPNLESVTALRDRMGRNPSVFKDIKIGPETKVPRTQEFLFSITFSYEPPKPTPPAAEPSK